MIIQSSQIAMASQRQATRYEEETESLNYWNNSASEDDAQKAVAGLQIKSDTITISHQQTEQLSISQIQTPTPVKRVEKSDELEFEEDLRHGWKLNLLRRLVSQLTGKEIKLFKASDFMDDDQSVAPPDGQAPVTEPTAQQQAPELEGWGLSYHYQHSTYESERTSFAAQGSVTTADGREINLNIGLTMSREFFSQEVIDLRAGDALKDPLVLNFSGTAAQLEETDLQFDIDLDGTADQLKFVSAGSGFLALDRNVDGQINDGSELFGPSSGDGFAELAAYDSDGNNWIDENDAIYDRLRIWERNAQGEYSLLALGQRGVGAIYLDRVATEFSINDEQNNQLGAVRTTGLFLQENGLAGTVQQLDLVV